VPPFHHRLLPVQCINEVLLWSELLASNGSEYYTLLGQPVDVIVKGTVVTLLSVGTTPRATASIVKKDFFTGPQLTVHTIDGFLIPPLELLNPIIAPGMSDWGLREP